MEYQVIIDGENPKSEYFATLEEAQDFQSQHENSRIFKQREDNPDLYEEMTNNDEKGV